MKKNKKLITTISICFVLVFILFLGVIYASNTNKGELNDDGKIDYADVSLLQLHLLHIQELPEEKHELADLNSDGKITITDLNILIKKIEKKLNYEVSISNLEVSNYYPNKNEEIELTFDADVNYNQTIKNVTINGRHYEAQKQENGKSYIVKIRVENTSGIKEYKLTEVTLNNDKILDIDQVIKVDVKKQEPQITNYQVEEDVQNSKLKIRFQVEDPENAFISGNYEIVEETTEDNTEERQNTVIQAGAIQVGSNQIEVTVEEGKKYKLQMSITYDLDTNTIPEETPNICHMSREENLSIITDYDFNLSDLTTYRNENENIEPANEFSLGEVIGLSFNSTNATEFQPKEAIVNGKTYQLEQKENIYTALVDGFTNTGDQTICIEKVILDNGKIFEVNQEKQVKIIKNTPTVVRNRINEGIEEKQIKLHFYVKDTDKTITDLMVKLYDEQDNEITTKNLTKNLTDENLIHENTDKEIQNTYYINSFIDVSQIVMPTIYKIKLFANYSLLENNSNYTHTDEIILEEELEAAPIVKIKQVNVSNKYPEKGENITLTYQIETNQEEKELTYIRVNNLRCIATKHIDNDDEVTYSVTLGAGEQAGILNLDTTEFIFEENLIATVANRTKVDVLKTKPTSEAFLQVDDIENRRVTLTANIVDPDGAFLAGKADLVKNETKEVVATKEFDNEHITFEINEIELNTEYTLVAKMTYDRDTNTLEEETNQNYVEDEIFRRRPIQLVSDYNVTIDHIKTYNQEKETKYFAKGEEVIIGFTSSNATNFYPVKAIINGQEYLLEKQDEEYRAVIEGETKFGSRDIRIEKIILNNTKEFIIDENNYIKVGVLKDRPTISKFAYEEQENNIIKVSFVVNDEEETITGGNIIVTDEDGNEIKTDPLTKEVTGITFEKGLGEEYTIQIIADYDLDTNSVTLGENEYTNQQLLLESIDVSTKRLFEMKDITEIVLFKGNEDNAEEVTRVTISDLADLSNYMVKVKMKKMPTFYANIEEYKIEDGILKFVLDYDNIIQYENGKKQNKLQVNYGTINGDVAENKSFKKLMQEMEANPDGTITLNQDYDISSVLSTGNTIITTEFRGTLNGNGHKIIGLNKPLFETLESANIQNLILEKVNLVGATSRGSLANSAQNTTVTNVHVKDLNMTTGADVNGGIIGDLQAGCTIEQSSVTKLHIKLNHIRIGGIAGKIVGSTIRNCYVQGIMESVTSTKDGVGGIAGDAWETTKTRIENCIGKIEFVNNTRAKNNGGILGLSRNNNVILTNNISLSTGTGPNRVHGSTIDSASTNNYELEESELISNASGNRVKKVSKAELTKEFFVEEAKFSEDIWSFEDVSYEHLPNLKNDDPNNSEEEIVEENIDSKIYIPEYDRIKQMPGFDKNKLVAYHNIQKLMPYYDSKYLVVDGATIPEDHELNTKMIRHILPYAEDELVTYITSDDFAKITSIKAVFEDNTVTEYSVNFIEFKQNIAIYGIQDLNLSYAYDNYAIKENGTMINVLTQYIEGLDYTNDLDILTTVADSRLYKDHYNEVIKVNAQTIALQLLQNEGNYILSMEHDVLNNIIRQELIDSGKLKKLLYAYNYYDRWYGFEIKGTKITDLMLFKGKMYSDIMTIGNLTEEVLTGSIGVNATNTFYANSIKKYTNNANIGQFLDNIIANIAGYEETNDWFTEYFGARNVLAEFGVDNKPEVLYRGWYQLKKNERMILPVITLPSNSAYMIAGPAHLQFGAQQLYHKDPDTAAGKAEVMKNVNTHVNLAKKHFSTLANSFDYGKWNRYCIMVYDCTKAITSYKTSYLPGTNIPLGTKPVYTQGKVGQEQPFFKNFSEVLGLWQPAGSSAGVGNTAGFLWFQATPGLTNYDTWTHEFEHALYDKIMLHQRGCRVQLETLTQGNVEQRVNWSENNLVQDVGPYYFNTSFNLNKEGNATQNLTPERINTKEKLENYYKGQQNALDLLDYIEGKAFIKLTPEQQAKIATRMSISAGWSSWGTITAEQASAMNLTSLESLYDNRIMLRPNNAWGVSVRGLNVINGIGSNDYGFESVWVNRWFIGHLDGGYADALSTKRNFFEMLGYAGVEGYVTYGSKASANDLDAIKKITKMVTGTEMDWRQYKMSRYSTIEENLDNKYIDVEFMIEKFTEALTNDATNGDRNISQRTALRKIYYHYLKSVTNDFVSDPLGTDIEVTHIKTAQELIEKINAKPYGYYILDNDIDFTGITSMVTPTFMGKLNGNGHKIIGNTNPIFQKIRYGYVKNLTFEGTDIPRNIANVGALSRQTQFSVLENISASQLKINSGGRNDASLIGGALSTVSYRNCHVEHLTVNIASKEDFSKIQEDPGGIFNITNDIDFTGYTGGNAVITETFSGKIEGNGHTISNLTNASLFTQFNGTVQNLTLTDFNNTAPTTDFVAAFATKSSNATFSNIKFENITLQGRNNVAVLVAVDNANSIFDKISIKNADISGSGVYIAGLVGRKYGGRVTNVYVEGNVSITAVANAGVIGSTETNVTMSNVVSKVNIQRTADSERKGRKQNAEMIGLPNSNTSRISNSITLGNMTGYVEDMVPHKFMYAEEALINTMLTNCYECSDTTGTSGVTQNTTGHLQTITRQNLNADFYRGLGFDENIWNFDTIATNGHPELK